MRSPRRRAARRIAVAACTGAVVTLAACGEPQDGEPQVAPRYVAMMKDVLDGSPSDLESAVLSDYVITDGEFQSAIDEYMSCMESHGLEADVQRSPLAYGATEESQDRFVASYAVRTEGLDVAAQITADCTLGNLASIGMIYYSIQSNPHGRSTADALRDCLASHGIDVDALSDADADALLAGQNVQGLDSPAVLACVEDPFSQ